MSMTMAKSASVLRPIAAAILITGALSYATELLTLAYTARLKAIHEFGYIIHEFDPYFNFRAAQYLYDNGWKRFVTWFDYMSWYPLGRPVGTTIYPGMQVTAVWLTKVYLPIWFGFKQWFGKKFGFGGSISSRVVTKSALGVSKSLSASGSSVMSSVATLMASIGMKWNEMSLNDVCCLVPAWFGALATLTTGLLALECSSNFGYNDGNRFGTVLDDIPLIGYFLQKIVSPIRNFLAHYAGMDVNATKASSLQTISLLSMLATMFFMSIVPAHMMRSVAGGYDNESVAMTAMTLVFWLWARSLRGGDPISDVTVTNGDDNVGMKIRQKQDRGFNFSSQTRSSFLFGALAGLAYFNMVAAWGGYVFVINLVGAHAATLVLLGRHSSKLHAAYSGFYVVGTALAVQVPVVGWTPIRSLEQLGPLFVFFGIQFVEYCERVRTRDNLTRSQVWLLRIRIGGLVALVGAVVISALWPTGYFGPISSRVRGLFVPHTKTGNPLVDSVAEHQAAKPGTYEQYLLILSKLAPLGFGMVAIGYTNDASSFLLVYGVAAYFFSHKMVRLILLTSPIASVLGGMLCGRVAGTCIEGVCGWSIDVWNELSVTVDNDVSAEEIETKPKAKKQNDNAKKAESKTSSSPNFIMQLIVRSFWFCACYFLYHASQDHINEFQERSIQVSAHMSHPSIIIKNQGHTMDDYREAYWWLRDNTPEDARIMAWWDYGYQITAIANRTTIADGNTWNHEHIALLGRALTSPLKDGHRIARHLADYVLLWTGGGGDDLAKSPHLARIANSVYRHMVSCSCLAHFKFIALSIRVTNCSSIQCPGDPTCSKFSAPGGNPSRMMRESLLFKLHSGGLVPGVEVDKNRFKEVYKSKYGKVRIYRVLSVSKESKEWVKNNRRCDAEGSWYCPGQYPPGLQKVLKDKKDFKQLEDFNAKTEADDEYQRKYFEHLNDPQTAARRAHKKSTEAKKDTETNKMTLTQNDIKQINLKWENNDITSTLFGLVRDNDVDTFKSIAQSTPHYLHMRSKDGRGPM